ncbi:type III-A CRISPR-associated RAMP protein Csm4 [Pyrococcus kukulkanii]|uniref:CRISPR system Cms protein Csm4 n=1 Tax=Pyrococcus kukulkanii TaxID=1609559 RepID=A0ABV4T5T3_9EURY
MEFRVIKLRLKGPLTEIPHADTLFGSIASALSLLFGEEAIEELVKTFMEGARISSAFPFKGNIYYLPKPLVLNLLDSDYTTDLKQLKRARFLDITNFKKAIFFEGNDKIEVPFSLPYVEVSVPRAGVDRVNSNSSLFFWNEVRFEEDAGIYFLYSGPNRTFKEKIKPAIRLLADSGISGKGTWGFGLFEPEFEKLRLKLPESQYSVTLSNVIPTKTPILWKILRKGGWSFGKRKPKIAFLTEGSIIKNDPGKFEVVDLGLPHTVYIYGMSFSIPIKLPEHIMNMIGSEGV